VQFAGEAESLKKALGEKYELLGIKTKNNIQQARIKIPVTLSPNELLNTLLPVCTIQGLREVLPSMNEIFITVVKGEPSKQVVS